MVPPATRRCTEAREYIELCGRRRGTRRGQDASRPDFSDEHKAPRPGDARASVLSKETNVNARDMWAALDLLEEEGKIVRTITPKDAGK